VEFATTFLVVGQEMHLGLSNICGCRVFSTSSGRQVDETRILDLNSPERKAWLDSNEYYVPGSLNYTERDDLTLSIHLQLQQSQIKYRNILT